MQDFTDLDLVRLVALLRSEVDALPHPGDAREQWLRRWPGVRRLVAEIDETATRAC